MDPDANLAEQRRIVAEIMAGDYTDPDAKLSRLAELVEGLDYWIANGGFLPRAWSAADANRRK